MMETTALPFPVGFDTSSGQPQVELLSMYVDSLALEL